MGGLFKDGVWYTKDDWGSGDDGSFQRKATTFHGEIAADEVQAGRYVLYVSYACPWASRALMVRALKGLEGVIPVVAVHHYMGEDGWAFRPEEDEASDADPLFGAEFLREIYLKADSNYTGRVTVPVLWDREQGAIVNNESSEIIRMMDTAFHGVSERDEVVLYPEALREAIDEATAAIYEPINNGVYRCGFAGTQEAYAQAFGELFEALDHWEGVLGEQRYMCGSRFTLADVCMFTTLVRFDPVYYVHFKCNGRLIAQHPNLSNYLREVYQMPGVAGTVNMHHIKQHYYRSHETVNAKRFVALGPDLSWYDEAHDRGRLPAEGPAWLIGE